MDVGGHIVQIIAQKVRQRRHRTYAQNIDPLGLQDCVNSIRKGEDNTYITNETVMLDSGETKEITAKVGLTEYDGNIVLAFWEEITATESDEILPAPLS